MNAADLLVHQARVQPHAPAFVTPDETVSHGQAAQRMRRMASALHGHGIGPGRRVAVCLPSSPAHLLSVLALAHLGAVAVPLFPRRPQPSLQAMAAQVGVDVAIGAGPGAPIAGLPFVGVDALQAGSPHSDRPEAAATAGGDDDFFIAWSSGTTGEPKAVSWSHRRVLRQFERMQSLRPHGPGVRLLVFMGYDASYALQAALRMLWSGGTLVMMNDVSLGSLATGIDRFGAQHLLSSPALVSALLDELPHDGPRFPTLQSVHLGGAAVPPRLHAALQRRLAANICVNAGSSEVGGLSYGVPGLLSRVPGSSGRVSPWVQAQAVDSAGRALAPGEAGELRYRADDFPAQQLGHAWRDGWYHPGDMGRVLADGTLMIEGRVDDLINLGGTKVLPGEVEAVLLEDPLLADAAAYGAQAEDGSTVLLAAVVARPGFDPVQALQRCRARLGRKAPQRLVQLAALPRNEAGKVLRSRLAANTRIQRSRPPQS